MVVAEMSKMGFGNRWVSLIMEAITTPRFAFIVNGTPEVKLFRLEAFGKVVCCRPIFSCCVRRDSRQ